MSTPTDRSDLPEERPEELPEHPPDEPPSGVDADAPQTADAESPEPPVPAGPDEVVRIPRDIWILVAAAFCVAIGYGIVAPVLPQYAASFGVGVQAASAIVSIFALARFVASPAGGELVDRLGERRVYMTGLLIVALSTGACALADSYVQLVTFRGLGGFGSAMFTVSASALMVRLAPPSIRGKSSSAMGSAFLIGNIAGPVLGGLTAELGYRVPFVIYAVMLLAATAVVAIFLKDADHRAVDAETGPRPVMRVGEALRIPAYRSVLTSGFANGWANMGVRVALIPLFAASIPALGVRWAGVALTVFALGNAAGLLTAGRMSDRYGRRPFIIGGYVVNALGTAALGLSHDVLPLLATSLVAGLGAGIANPAQQAAVADIIGRDRAGGKVLSGFQMMQDAGTISGPVIIGALVGMAASETTGYSIAFAVTGAIVLAGALAWLPVKDPSRSANRA